MNPRCWTLLLLIAMGWNGWCMAAEMPVTDGGAARHEKTGIVVVAGTLKLPAEGYWMVPNPYGLEGSITQIFLKPPQDWMQQQQGRRMMQAQQEKKLDQSMHHLRGYYWRLSYYACKHEGVGPATLEDVIDQEHDWMQNFYQSPYADEFDVNDPSYALLPNVPFTLTGDPPRVDRNVEGKPLAVELMPYFNDGKHWVLYTNGEVRRVEIDHTLMDAHRLKVTALQERPTWDDGLADSVVYEVYGLQRPGQKDSVRFQIQNTQTQETVDCLWQPTDASADAEIIKTWVNLRAGSWLRMVTDYDAPVLKQWTAIQQGLYGSESIPQPRGWRRRHRDRQISMFGVLGGQAALQETFQLQQLQVTSAQDANGVPIDQIEGVAVKSHPFKEMLAGQPGGRLPLAEVVPSDCLFVHFAQPKAVLPFLEKGSAFLSHLGSLSLGRNLDYDLVDGYLARLGVTQDLLKQMLQLDMVQEFGIILPDLFLIDGTEVTIVARAPQFQLLLSLLKVIGIEQLVQGKIIDVPTTAGTSAYWTVDGDLLFISTHRAELERVLQCHQNQGLGSLGRSDEFKYMLTQLPLTERTRAYAYFSDPFIRRLVSPATKIAQLRRLQTRVNLNLATSAALLYRLDQQPGEPTVACLVEAGYLPRSFPQGDIQLDEKGMARSKTYGPNSQLKSLTAIPVTMATGQEAQAYQRYVEAYRRYWRQYFDPVAVRLDETQDGGLELTTFILPLLDSWLYTQVREFVPGQQGPPLDVPQIKPAPIALFSLNLSDKIWTNMIGSMIRSVAATDTSFVDDFGPALHVAIQDADPILAFGGGDLLDIAGQMQGFNNMMMIPVVVSLFTRPCAILIETQNPDRLVRFLEQGGLSALLMNFEDGLGVDSYRVTGRDAWVLCLDLFGMAKLRFGAEVQGNTLIVTNQPWSQHLTIAGVTPSPLHDLTLHLEPMAAQQQLAAMFTSAAEKQRRAALQGSAMLMPLVWTGDDNISAALRRHQQLFGFTPQHPAPGIWRLNDRGQVVSSDYGTPGQTQQPGYEPGRQGFGLLQGINPVEVSLQIEDTGLRSRIYWKYAVSK